MATSNFRIKKICEWCGKEFEAQKVSTRFCSHRCANFAYKRAIRKKRVQTTESQTQVQKTERIIEDIKEKEYLSFSETGRLLGLSRQAIYTMVKAGHLKASKISSRLSFIRRTDIDAMLQNKPYQYRMPKDTIPPSQTSIPPMRLKRNSVSKIPGYFISLRNIIFHEPFTVEKPIGAKSILMITLQRKLPILKSRNGTAHKTCRRSSA